MRYLLNTTVIPNDGVFKLSSITKEDARKWVSEGEFISAIGHPGTAEVISALLGTKIAPNRIMVQFEPGDEALVFKLDCRLPEGKVLSAEELKNLSYKWKILKRLTSVLP